ncbi:hypothetical protein [Acidovorax sp. JHL-9]|uniref:hypothetical protein n=1 Tax=Acidovorax sp. JHL-9 TaxID=1276756 RepID=UPI00041C8E3E|nr:hypothetical protein [Acidovorax sp. JHL-9]
MLAGAFVRWEQFKAGSHPGQQGDLLEQWQDKAVGLAEVALVGVKRCGGLVRWG